MDSGQEGKVRALVRHFGDRMEPSGQTVRKLTPPAADHLSILPELANKRYLDEKRRLNIEDKPKKEKKKKGKAGVKFSVKNETNEETIELNVI